MSDFKVQMWPCHFQAKLFSVVPFYLLSFSSCSNSFEEDDRVLFVERVKSVRDMRMVGARWGEIMGWLYNLKICLPLILKRRVAYPNWGWYDWALLSPSFSPPLLPFFFFLWIICAFFFSTGCCLPLCLSGSSRNLYTEDTSPCWSVSSYPLRFSSAIPLVQKAFTDPSLLCFANSLGTQRCNFNFYIRWCIRFLHSIFPWNCELH